MTDPAWPIEEWTGLYGESWKGAIVDKAFKHPAKYSRALIRHIYNYLIKAGYLKAGDRVIDPFGGVALGGLDAMRLGLHWTGVEIEAPFVELGQANIAKWNSEFAGRLALWGSAAILQGDSRKLGEVVKAAAQGAVSSPPYAGNEKSDYQLTEDGKHRKRDQRRGKKQGQGSFRGSEAYGDTPGQLGRMRDKDFDAAISSPPFLQQSGGTNVTAKGGPLADKRLIDRHSAGNAAAKGYGESNGQLGGMREGEFEGAVSSPPYSETHVTTISTGRIGDNVGKPYQQTEGDQYGATAGQLGQTKGDTFWTASREIVAQVYSALAPGAVAVWVVKAFVRNKKIVDFPDQWRQLCEAAGFETIAEFRAMVIERAGQKQLAHDPADDKDLSISRKSFFRRMMESKGSPKIDCEVVWIMRKAK